MSEPSEGVCATAGCSGAPAFKTRTRKAWCTPCLERVFADAGLHAIEAPKKYGEYTLTECAECGCQADYRLEYVLEKRDFGIGVCRACFWRDWARSQRDRTFGDPSGGPVANGVDIRQRVEQGGWDYLGPLTSPSLEDDPHRVRCPVCGKITVGRLGDIAGGCSCSRNPKGSSPSGIPQGISCGFQQSCARLVGSRSQRSEHLGDGDGPVATARVVEVPNLLCRVPAQRERHGSQRTSRLPGVLETTRPGIRA